MSHIDRTGGTKDLAQTNADDTEFTETLSQVAEAVAQSSPGKEAPVASLDGFSGDTSQEVSRALIGETSRFKDLVAIPEYTLHGLTNRSDGFGSFFLDANNRQSETATGLEPFSLDEWNNKKFTVDGQDVFGIGALISTASSAGPNVFRETIDQTFFNNGATVILAGRNDFPEILGMFDIDENEKNGYFTLRFGLALSEHAVNTPAKRAALNAAIEQMMPWAGAIDFNAAFAGFPSEINTRWAGVSWEFKIHYNADNIFEHYTAQGTKISDDIHDMTSGTPAEFFAEFIPRLADNILKFMQINLGTAI